MIKQSRLLLTAAGLAIASASPLAFAQADNTNARIAPASPTFDTWMGGYSQSHQGRISRQAYMDEVGRRWDAADQRNQGLTVEEVNRAYGLRSNQTDPATGTITAPGYMGPKDAKK